MTYCVGSLEFGLIGFWFCSSAIISCRNWSLLSSELVADVFDVELLGVVVVVPVAAAGVTVLMGRFLV